MNDALSPGGGRIELKIPASSQWVRVARLTVAGVASRQHFSIESIEDIKLAVTEAINNAIQHGPHRPGESAMVTICLESDEHGLWIAVTDEGKYEGVLPLTKEAPLRDENNLPEGGLGLLLIRSLMDEVTQETDSQSNTVLKMFKRLPNFSSPQVK